MTSSGLGANSYTNMHQTRPPQLSIDGFVASSKLCSQPKRHITPFGYLSSAQVLTSPQDEGFVRATRSKDLTTDGHRPHIADAQNGRYLYLFGIIETSASGTKQHGKTQPRLPHITSVEKPYGEAFYSNGSQRDFDVYCR